MIATFASDLKNSIRGPKPLNIMYFSEPSGKNRSSLLCVFDDSQIYFVALNGKRGDDKRNVGDLLTHGCGQKPTVTNLEVSEIRKENCEQQN
ncbi:hypothetical protein L596_013783 [Steinernema carpocapsae]|uniref:Uncharacterized protein n=1 Tax=Steinernema carpocapsae TaxID=34508 RepID=A0A4U5P2C9_STECR|nr:hypothetical protein L596_013783 [Steinernema carpocapsae]